jgi:hypothetical protein
MIGKLTGMLRRHLHGAADGAILDAAQRNRRYTFGYFELHRWTLLRDGLGAGIYAGDAGAA